MSKRLTFMDPLVLAIMADEKTVTRRLTAPRFVPGDVVDVCEALVPWPTPMPGDMAVSVYRADGAVVLRPHHDGTTWTHPWGWKVRVLPARYCPAWAVRTRLEIVDVRPEFLTAIDEADATREGLARMGLPTTRLHFLTVFRLLHDLADDADPTVFRIEFRRVSP